MHGCTLLCALFHAPGIESFDVESGVTKGGLFDAWMKSAILLVFGPEKYLFKGRGIFQDNVN